MTIRFWTLRMRNDSFGVEVYAGERLAGDTGGMEFRTVSPKLYFGAIES